MELKPLYLLRYHYPDGWGVDLSGDGGSEEHHFYFAEGRCDGELSGAFRAANHPRRRTDRTFRMEMQGIVETDDGGTVMVDFQGYGRSYPAGRRQVVGAAFHVSDHEVWSRLNDVVCAVSGEVRAPGTSSPQQSEVELVFQVYEMVWGAPPN